MNILSVSDITQQNVLNLNSAKKTEDRNFTFESLLNAATGLVKETNDNINAAEQAEMAYALGLMDNTHDLLGAQWKANISLQYTTAIRNQVLDAYKEIMNLQF